ncbi:hypothetical protein ACHAXR_003054, partial [Thalassiosira sp. AJA248-18]
GFDEQGADIRSGDKDFLRDVASAVDVPYSTCVDCCDGTDACSGASADISDGSCNGYNACNGASATIGSGSCNATWACKQSTGDIGDNACTDSGAVRGEGCSHSNVVIPDNCPSVAALDLGECKWETMYGNPCSSEADYLAGDCNSTANPTNAPTNAPTPNPTNAPTNAPTTAHVIAEYDSDLKAPRCASLGKSCSSGILLDGKGSNIEPDYPNTLDSCTDGSGNVYHADESIDSIKVSALEGDQLQAGGLAEIEAVVWPYGDGFYNYADFYYTADVGSQISWEYIDSITPSAGGLQTLKLNFTLHNSVTQAVRVNFRYQGIQSSCTGGVYDDVDDLVFAVAPSSVEGDSLLVQDAVTKVTMKPKSVAPLKKRPEDHCAMVDNKDRCDKVVVCTWNENGKRCRPNPNSVIQSENVALG